MMDGENSGDPQWVAQSFAVLRSAIRTVIIGQDEAVRLSFVTLLCSGHSLYEGVPGVAKTLLVRTLATAIGVRFGRIQCTPDMMPSDIIGTPVLHAGGEFRFRPGPLFTDLLLVDEINRAPAKTQAALLEAMQERAATVDGIRYSLGDWFTVLATQNPIEQEGTYPLPEAELDRFLFKIRIGYPSAEEEVRIVAAHHASAPALHGPDALVGAAELARARAQLSTRHAGARGNSALRGVARARDARPSGGCGRRPRRARRSGRSAPPRRSPRSRGAALCCPRTCRPLSARPCGIAWSLSPARRLRGWSRPAISFSGRC
jgi:MoxR-like ATPase